MKNKIILNHNHIDYIADSLPDGTCNLLSDIIYTKREFQYAIDTMPSDVRNILYERIRIDTCAQMLEFTSPWIRDSILRLLMYGGKPCFPEWYIEELETRKHPSNMDDITYPIVIKTPFHPIHNYFPNNKKSKRRILK